MNGVTYTKGLGVHAPSEIIYNLNGAYSSFLSDIGIDDESGETTCGSVVFEVYLDNVLAYASGTMNATTATKSINLNVAGKNQLKLVVTIAGDNNYCDHADWANARLTAAARLGESAISLGEVSVYPNSAKGTVNLKIQSEVAQQVKLSLTNAQGRQVISQVKSLQAGDNTLSVAVDQLAAGLTL